MNILHDTGLPWPALEHLTLPWAVYFQKNISTPETLRRCPGPTHAKAAKEQIGPSTNVESLGIVSEQHPELHPWSCLLLPWAKRNLMWNHYRRLSMKACTLQAWVRKLNTCFGDCNSHFFPSCNKKKWLTFPYISITLCTYISYISAPISWVVSEDLMSTFKCHDCPQCSTV